MTAVASPPSLPSLQRLGWNTGSSGQGGLNSMSADEVSRMFMPRPKNMQRTNSSSSIASSNSSSTTVTSSASQANGSVTSNGDSASWATKKKPARGLWPSSKAEAVSGVSSARPQPVSTTSSGPTASSAMSAIHQPSPVLPSQHMLQSQQNGARGPNGQVPNEPPAILTLLPMNGTFERKQITVPFFPEVLRVGRQTNAKTVPTPQNGYFDSKVLSRQHAEVWAERNGKIWIRDVKSSNGTFVNGQRLSQENRDSEPHELREHDMLELGIDIVSEDQKTIVHHKVSAKVEHAGLYGATPNILDLNFGDIDPTAGGGLLPSPLSQPMAHSRGRPSSAMSNGRNSAAQSVANSQMALNQQRQMNFWLSPISIEQVVKKLTSEMKVAREQTVDLDQTKEFLGGILTPDGEKPKMQSSPTDQTGSRLPNGKPKIPKIDAMSRFSDPPAPPPQQPLPEKPDGSRSSPSDVISHAFLKHVDTEKPKSGPSNSPTNTQSSQILSLVEALSHAKKELDSQGIKVRQLEDQLRQERSAKERAEERARKLEQQSRGEDQVSEVEAAFEPPAEPENQNPQVAQDKVSEKTSKLWKETNGISEKDAPTDTLETKDDKLQQRLDILVAEMDEMKIQMESYRQRAEAAESEAVSTRVSLAEMIEKLRHENAEAAAAAERQLDDSTAQVLSMGEQDRDAAAVTVKPKGLQNGQAVQPARLRHLERAVATALAGSRDGGSHNELLTQSAPYASMLGVVLIGMGLMAYLNTWQKVEK